MRLQKSVPSIRLAVIVLSLVILVSGCSGSPRVTHYPAPQFNLNTATFNQAGCSEEAGGKLVCPPDSPIGKLGCDSLAAPGTYLGGLEPAYPLNICWKDQAEDEDQYIYRDGCLRPQYLNYIIQDRESYRLITNKAELAATYAPILDKDEALSYAMAATGLAAYFDLQPVGTQRYFTKNLEDTHVDVTSDGYVVHLFAYQLCGCGPHTTTAVAILVRQDGRLEELERKPVFEDPEQDGLCID
jgi:hypothetical protein